MPEALISGWSLVAAVRSFLHFSQLSAWLSASGGSQPPNVLYRLTVTSPVFCSKFVAESEEHTFPIANVGQDTAIKVSFFHCSFSKFLMVIRIISHTFSYSFHNFSSYIARCYC